MVRNGTHNRIWTLMVSIMLIVTLVVCTAPVSATEISGSETEPVAAEEAAGSVDEEAEAEETDDEASEEETAVDEEADGEVPPEDEETEETIDEEALSDEEAEEVFSDYPAFDQSQTVDGVEIRAEAPEGVFPEGAVLSVTRILKEDRKSVQEALDTEREENRAVASSYTFDICVIDEEGNELQPEEGQVKVTFTAEEVNKENLTTDVYHLQAEEKTGYVAEKLETEVDQDQASVVTDSFSYYTVEFTYESRTYVMQGDTSVSLDEILAFVGLTGTIISAESSDPDLFSTSEEDGEWTVTAHKAFASEEELTVTIEEVDYDIPLEYREVKRQTRKLRVTDDQDEPTTRKITVTKTWEGDDESVRPDNLTLNLKKSESVMLPGPTFEEKIKSIAGMGGTNTDNTTIISIVQATPAQYEAVRSSLTSANELQASGEKTYGWFSNGTLYLYSEAENVYTNTNAAGMFRKLKAVTSISGLSMFNTHYSTDMNRMFQDSTKITTFAPIADWDVGYVTDMTFIFGSNDWTNNPFVANSFEPFRNWDVSNVSSFNQAFKGWRSVTTMEPLSQWNVGRVKDFNQTFNWMSGGSDAGRAHIKGWDVSAVTIWTNMFNNNGGTPVEPNFTIRPGTWNNKGTYSTTVPASSPPEHTVPGPIPSGSSTAYSNPGTTSGDGTNPGDCVVTKSGNTWTYEFTVYDDGSVWYAWEDTTDGTHLDDKNGLADAYTESSGGTDGLGGSEDNAIRGLRPGDSTAVTNTNTTRKEVTVTKTWADDSDAVGRRPTSLTDVNLRLKKNGTDVKTSNDDTSKWSQTGDTWTYTFIWYDNDSVTDCTVAEDAVANYTNNGPSGVTKTSGAGVVPETGTAEITNTLEKYDLSVVKQVTGNQGDKTKGFPVTIVVSGAGANATYTISTDSGTPSGAATLTTDGSGSGTAVVSLKDTDGITLQGLPAGSGYEVREAYGDYTPDQSVRGDSGAVVTAGKVEKTVSTGGIIADTEITFVNNKGGALPTGLFPDSLPMKLLMALSALLILVFCGLIYRKKRLEE